MSAKKTPAYPVSLTMPALRYPANISRYKMKFQRLSRNALILAVVSCAMAGTSCASLTPPPQPERTQIQTPAKPTPKPPADYLTECPASLPTLPMPIEGESLSGDLVWNTVLVGWSKAYHNCALNQARLVGWHKGLEAGTAVAGEEKQARPWWRF